MRFSPIIDGVVDEALGRRVRVDPVRPRTGGPAGNAHLTAWTGVVLLPLVLAELVTLLDVTGLVGWHVALGTALVPVALLKTGSTAWRMLRYYAGQREYRSAGPPPTLLRWLGPLVVASTLGVLGSGVALVIVGPQASQASLVQLLGRRVDLLTVHKALFLAFGAAVGLHVVARAAPAAQLTRGRNGVPVPGRLLRGAVLAAVLAVAGWAAAALLPLAGAW